MSFEEILKGIIQLSHSQGFYGRLLEDISELNEDEYNDLKKFWEDQHFKTFVDFIVFIEE